MLTDSKITNIITSPHHPNWADYKTTTPGSVLSVGIVVDDNQVFWGDCLVDVHRDLAEYSAFSTPADFIEAIDAIVKPTLINAPLNSFRYLCEQLEDIRETVTLSLIHI